MSNNELVYVIAENHRAAVEYLTDANYTGDYSYVYSANTLRDGEQGLLYAVAPGGQERKDWLELLDMLVAKEALHY
jgi:hypothetical protein